MSAMPIDGRARVLGMEFERITDHGQATGKLYHNFSDRT
jgi:hypothetical protein